MQIEHARCCCFQDLEVDGGTKMEAVLALYDDLDDYRDALHAYQAAKGSSAEKYSPVTVRPSPIMPHLSPIAWRRSIELKPRQWHRRRCVHAPPAPVRLVGFCMNCSSLPRS